MLTHITLKTSTFCEKSYEERHVENLNTLGDARCTRCFQHTDLQGKMLQSTPIRADTFGAIDLGDLHGCFRHNWVSRSASHHINLSLHTLPWNSGSRLSFLIEHD